MASVPKPAAPPPKPAIDEKWLQQIRLACVQAVMARAVASASACSVQDAVFAADRLARFVVNGD